MTRFPEQVELDTCGMCGELSADVAVRLVEWTDDAAKSLGRRYQDVPRCGDRDACRRRVEQVLGVPWPVNDRTPAPAPAEPVAAVPVPAVDAEEEISWLR